MKLKLLFSGGKDSSLAAIILSKLGYRPILVNCNFGLIDSWKIAQQIAQLLGFEFELIRPELGILEQAAEICIQDGFPRRGIHQLHKQVICWLAARLDSQPKLIADGTRRDDKTPVLSHAEIQSIEMKYGISYLRPLAGFGKSQLIQLAQRYLEFIQGPGIHAAEYELELREFISREYGPEWLRIFPGQHQHSRVISLKLRDF